MDEIKKVKVKISVDNKDSLKAFKKSETAMGDLTKSVKNLALGFVGFAAVMSGVTKSVKLAIDAEETHSKLLTVFRGETEATAAVVKDLSDNYILSKSSAEALLASTGDLLTGIGLTTKEALKLSEQTVKMGADLASFNNFAGGAAGAAKILEKALLGERESLKSLGISINETDVKQRLMATGQDKLTGIALKAARAQETLNLIMKQSPNAIGDVERTSDSTANTLKKLENQLEDLGVEIGDELLPVVKDLADWAIENKDKIAAVFVGIAKALGLVAKGATKFIDFLGDIKDFVLNENQTKPLTADDIIKAETFGELRKQWSDFSAEVEANISGLGDRAKREFAEFEETMINIAKSQKTVKEQTSLMRREFEKIEGQKRGKELQDFLGKVVKGNEAWKKVLEERAKAQAKANAKGKEGSKGGKENIKLTRAQIKAEKARLKQLKAIEDGWDAVFKAQKKARIELLKSLPTTEGLTKNLEGLREKGLIPGIKSTKELTEETKEKAIADIRAAIEAEKHARAEEKLFKALDNVMMITSEVIGGLGDLGLISGDTEQKLGNIANAAGNLAAGIIKKDPVAIISGAIQSVSALFKLFEGDGIGKAADRRLEGLGGLTKDWTEEIKKLAEEMGGTNEAGRAFNATLDDIIKSSDIGANNFDVYVQKVREVFSAFERGEATASETAKNFGDAFTEIAKKAEEMGQSGSEAMTGLILLADEMGVKVPEVAEFVKKGWEKAVDGWRKFKEETGSTIELPALDEIIAKQDELAKDKYQPALNGLAGLQEALINMSNVTRLSQEEFDSLGDGADEIFASLKKSGLDSGAALEQMAPTLSRLIFLQDEFGLKIDESTQAIIDQAKEEGINLDIQKSIGEQQLDLQKQQLEIFKEIAFALGVNADKMDQFGDSTAKAFNKAGKGLDAFGNGLNNLKTPNLNFGDIGGNIPSFAKGGEFTVPNTVGPEGMLMRVHRGEPVSVTPAGKADGNKSGGDVIVNIFPERGDSETEIMNKVIRGYRNNVSNAKVELNA
jgi:hypothetical protein